MQITSTRDIERYTSSGWWGTQTLYGLFCEAAARAPSDVAIIDPPNRLDFTEGAPLRLDWLAVQAQVDRLCSVFLRAGLAYDDVVVVQLPTTHEFLIVYLACARLGVIPSPVPVQYRAHELEFIVSHVQAKAFISMSRISGTDHGALTLELSRKSRTPMQAMLFGSSIPDGALALDAEMQRPPDLAGISDHVHAYPVGANDIATILWTSGTESRPKAVPRTHNQWLVARRLMTDAAELAMGCRILSPRMLGTMGGFSGSVVTWLDRSACLVLHQPFKLDVFINQIKDEAIDFTSGPPAVLHELLKREDLLAGVDFSRLRHISSGSAALSEWVVQTFRSRYGVEVLNFYGSSEGASLAATAQDLPDPALRARYFPRYGAGACRSTQTSAQYVESRLVDVASGEVIENTGRTGELCFRGPNVFSGYFASPDITARTLDADGFYRTGDLFCIAGEDAQYLEFVGRTKDIIVRGGVNISADEVESLLIGHPDIDSVAVVGYPDEKLGERVCAVVTPTQGAKPELHTLCKYLSEEKSVAVYKLPQRLILLDSMPRNPAGKILKTALREMARKE